MTRFPIAAAIVVATAGAAFGQQASGGPDPSRHFVGLDAGVPTASP